MSTLSKQLKQLQVETTVGKSQATFLFNARDVGKYDIPTIFGIGVNGFAELMQIDRKAFSPYASTLFSETWMDMDRSVKDQETNDEINKQISGFALAVAPYFQLKAAHKTLEWLIRRFKVHVHNIDALMSMAIIHCDTAAFGRLVQILELNSGSLTAGPGSSTVPIWHFLQQLKQSGAVLSRETLIRQCSVDTAVLRFICDLALNSAELSSQGLCSATSILTFYSIIVSSVMTSRSSTVSDSMVGIVIPYLLQGLRSSVQEFQSSSFAIGSAFLSSGGLSVSRKTFNAIVKATFSGITSESNVTFVISFLVTIFAGQASHQGLSTRLSNGELFPFGDSEDPSSSKFLLGYRFPPNAIQSLLSVSEVADRLSSISASRDVSAFLRCLIMSSVEQLERDTSQLDQIMHLITSVDSTTLGKLAGFAAAQISLRSLSFERSSVSADSRAGLARLLRALSQRFPTEVDLGMQLASARASAYSESLGMSGAGVTAATRFAANWAAEALADSSIMRISVDSLTSAGGAGLDSVSLEFALGAAQLPLRLAAVNWLLRESRHAASLQTDEALSRVIRSFLHGPTGNGGGKLETAGSNLISLARAALGAVSDDSPAVSLLALSAVEVFASRGLFVGLTKDLKEAESEDSDSDDSDSDESMEDMDAVADLEPAEIARKEAFALETAVAAARAVMHWWRFLHEGNIAFQKNGESEDSLDEDDPDVRARARARSDAQLACARALEVLMLAGEAAGSRATTLLRQTFLLLLPVGQEPLVPIGPKGGEPSLLQQLQLSALQAAEALGRTDQLFSAFSVARGSRSASHCLSLGLVAVAAGADAQAALQLLQLLLSFQPDAEKQTSVPQDESEGILLFEGDLAARPRMQALCVLDGAVSLVPRSLLPSNQWTQSEVQSMHMLQELTRANVSTSLHESLLPLLAAFFRAVDACWTPDAVLVAASALRGGGKELQALPAVFPAAPAGMDETPGSDQAVAFNFLKFVGSSGSGKSSSARARLVVAASALTRVCGALQQILQAPDRFSTSSVSRALQLLSSTPFLSAMPSATAGSLEMAVTMGKQLLLTLLATPPAAVAWKALAPTAGRFVTLLAPLPSLNALPAPASWTASSSTPVNPVPLLLSVAGDSSDALISLRALDLLLLLLQSSSLDGESSAAGMLMAMTPGLLVAATDARAGESAVALRARALQLLSLLSSRVLESPSPSSAPSTALAAAYGGAPEGLPDAVSASLASFSSPSSVTAVARLCQFVSETPGAPSDSAALLKAFNTAISVSSSQSSAPASAVLIEDRLQLQKFLLLHAILCAHRRPLLASVLARVVFSDFNVASVLLVLSENAAAAPAQTAFASHVQLLSSAVGFFSTTLVDRLGAARAQDAATLHLPQAILAALGSFASVAATLAPLCAEFAENASAASKRHNLNYRLLQSVLDAIVETVLALLSHFKTFSAHQIVVHGANATETTSSCNVIILRGLTLFSAAVWSCLSPAQLHRLLNLLLLICAEADVTSAAAARKCLLKMRIQGRLLAEFLKSSPFSIPGFEQSQKAEEKGKRSKSEKKEGEAEEQEDSLYTPPVAAFEALKVTVPSLQAAQGWLSRLSTLLETFLSILQPVKSASSTGTDTPAKSEISEAYLLAHPLVEIAHLLFALRSRADVANASTSSAGAEGALINSNNTPSGPETASSVTLSALRLDILPSLEYASYLVLCCLHPVCLSLSGVESAEAVRIARGIPPQLPLHCLRSLDSLQSRAAAVLLLSDISSLLPNVVLRQLVPALVGLGASLRRDDNASASVLQSLVEAMVPPLKVHGAAVGVPLLSLFRVFAALGASVPHHRLKVLLGSLVSIAAAVPDAPAASTAVSKKDQKKGSKEKDKESSDKNSEKSNDKSRFVAPLIAMVLAQHVQLSAAGGSKENPLENSANSELLQYGAELDALYPSRILSQEPSASNSTPPKGKEHLDILSNDSLGPLPDVCAGLLARFSAAQQTACLSDLVQAAIAIIQTTLLAGGDQKDLKSADSLTLSGYPVSEVVGVILARGPEGFGAEGAAAPTRSQRIAIALSLLKFVAVSLSSAEFVSAATAAFESLPGSAALAGTAANSSSSGERLQKRCMLLSDSVFEALQTSFAVRQKVDYASQAQLKIISKASGGSASAGTSSASVSQAQVALDSLNRLSGITSTFISLTLDLMERLTAVLPPPAHVAVVSSLLNHPSLSIRARACDFFKEHLTSLFGPTATPSPSAAGVALLYVHLLPDLLQQATSPHNAPATTTAGILETSEKRIALSGIASMAEALAKTHPAAFKPVLEAIIKRLGGSRSAGDVVEVFLDGTDEMPTVLRVSLLCCAARVCTALGAAAVAFLHPLVHRLLDAVQVSSKKLAVGSGYSQETTQQSSFTSELTRLHQFLQNFQETEDPILFGLNNQAQLLPSGVNSIEETAMLAVTSLRALQAVVKHQSRFLSRLLPRCLAVLSAPEVIGALGPVLPVRIDRVVSVAASGEPILALNDLHAPPRQLPSSFFSTTISSNNNNNSTANNGSTPSSTAVSNETSTIPSETTILTAPLATETLSTICSVVEPRVLLPILLAQPVELLQEGVLLPSPGELPATSSTSHRALRAELQRTRSLVHALVLHVRSVATVMVRLSIAELREYLSLLVKFALLASDARAVTPFLADVAAVETAVGALLAALAVRLSEKQLVALFSRLQLWSAVSPSDVAAERSLFQKNSGSADWHRGRLAAAVVARKLTMYRLLDAIAAVAKSLVVPYFAPLLRSIAVDLAVSAKMASLAKESMTKVEPEPEDSKASKKLKAAKKGPEEPEVVPPGNDVYVPVHLRRGDAPVVPKSDKKKRENEDDSSDSAETDEAEDSSDADEEESEKREDQRAMALSESIASALFPSVIYMSGSFISHTLLSVSPGAPPIVGGAPFAPGSSYFMVPPSFHLGDVAGTSVGGVTSVHALRCYALALLRRIFLHDGAQGAEALMSVGPARLESLLPSIVMQFQLPVDTTPPQEQLTFSPLSAMTPAAAVAPAGSKRARQDTPPLATATFNSSAAVAGAMVPQGNAGFSLFSETYLVPLVASLTLALKRDALWKPLCSALLLLARDGRARVRAQTVAAIGTIFQKGREDALVLLPEVLPFFAELQNDSDRVVEQRTHQLLVKLEKLSGENLQQYLV